MYAACDGAKEIKEGYPGAGKSESSGIDAGLEEPAVLLENVNVDVNLGSGVKRSLNDGLKC